MSTIIRYSTDKNGSSSLLVDAGFADAIIACLQKAGVAASGPTHAVFSTKRIYRDASGRVQVEDEPIESEIVINQTPENLERILGGCLLTL